MTASVWDATPCDLGEGPLWHPVLEQLFWFDITGMQLFTRTDQGRISWRFDRHVSAAGWLDENRLLVATERDLITFDMRDASETVVARLEPDNPATRSNDGRADPQGGFWIGTMAKSAKAGKGALYRYYRGDVRKLADGLTIPNATCFDPDGQTAYFADTAQRLVWRIALDAEGWPKGEWQVFLDHRATAINPDGAVVDASGIFWCAEWGGARVAGYDRTGNLAQEIAVPAPHVTCPAFGGPDMTTLFATSARQGMQNSAMKAAPLSGQTFAIADVARGQAEHRVIL